MGYDIGAEQVYFWPIGFFRTGNLRQFLDYINLVMAAISKETNSMM